MKFKFNLWKALRGDSILPEPGNDRGMAKPASEKWTNGKIYTLLTLRGSWEFRSSSTASKYYFMHRGIIFKLSSGYGFGPCADVSFYLTGSPEDKLPLTSYISSGTIIDDTVKEVFRDDKKYWPAIVERLEEVEAMEPYDEKTLVERMIEDRLDDIYFPKVRDAEN